MDDNSSIKRYFLEIQNYFEVLKFLDFQKPLNLLIKISNGHIFFWKKLHFRSFDFEDKDSRTFLTESLHNLKFLHLKHRLPDLISEWTLIFLANNDKQTKILLQK